MHHGRVVLLAGSGGTTIGGMCPVVAPRLGEPAAVAVPGDIAEWRRIATALPVPVIVGHDWAIGQHEDAGRDHIVAQQPLVVGGLRRDAGAALCETPQRFERAAQDPLRAMERTPESTLGTGRLVPGRAPTCRECFRVAVKVAASGGAPLHDRIARMFSAARFTGRAEIDYQNAVQDLLAAAGMPHLREARLSPRDRVDFLVGSVGVEVKVDGSRPDIIRQLARYAESPAVSTLVLASSQIRLLKNIPTQVHGVPLKAVALRGGLC